MNMIKTYGFRLLPLLLLVIPLGSASPGNEEYWLKKLSPEEKEAFDVINWQRETKDLTPLHLNGELSSAIREELTKLVEAEKDSPTVAENTKRLLPSLPGKCYLFTDTTILEVLAHLRQKGEIRQQMLDGKNLSVAIAHAEGKQNATCTYICFSNYFMDYLIREEIALSPGDETGRLVSAEIEGKCNARYLKVLCYPGTRFLFLQEPEEVYEEEMEVRGDSSFVISLPIDKFGKGTWSIAILVRNTRSEPYELVKLFKRGEQPSQ
ncbi:MAG: hypothetical protein WBF13_02310 [Candidatus Zixiibacteriota bacterium]